MPDKKPPKVKPECKACTDPGRYTDHTCGLKKLQDMLIINPRRGRK